MNPKADQLKSRSDAEFVARLGIALEEADEAALWLEIVTEDGMSRAKKAFELLDEATQLAAILTASSVTAAQNLRRPRMASNHQ